MPRHARSIDDAEPMHNTIVHTIGHSTRSIEEFLVLLQAHRIAALVDVRRFPGSRRYPHFNEEALARALPSAGIEYVALKELGGRRRPAENSPNMYWRNESFRGYADYMATPEFQTALNDLVRIAAAGPAAVMCSEAVPWRCHRNLISDALVLLRDIPVKHILSASPAQLHEPSPFAVRQGAALIYPSRDPEKVQQDLWD